MLKNRTKRDPNLAFAKHITERYTRLGAQAVDSQTTNQMLSFENLSDVDRTHVEDRISAIVEGNKTFLTELANDRDFGLEAFGKPGTPEFERNLEIAAEAAAVVTMAAGAVSAYAAKAGTVIVDPSAVPFNTQGTDYRIASLESFDEKELSAHLPYSAVFSAFAARQDPASELFFNTAVITPDQAGLDIIVSIPTVFSNLDLHKANGNPADFGKRSLVSAIVDSTILSDEATRLIPVAQPDNSNADKFVPVANVATAFRRISGFDVPTRPLAIGKEIDLIGISSFSPLLGAGVMTNTDAVDSAITLSAVYLAADVDEAAVRFDTLLQPRNGFVKSVEGNFREMNLQFSNRSLIIDGTKKAVDNTDVPAFAPILANNWKVYLSVSVNGVFNVEFGNVKVMAFPVTVDLIQDNTGATVSTTSGAGATLKTAIEAFKIVGYDLKTNRTNSNLRTRGHVVDTTLETERHTIPLGSPITYPSPVHAQGREGDIKVAINAARARNSNLAITTLLQYADTLEALVKGPTRRDGVLPQVAGAARHVVKPWFERRNLDVSLSINSEKAYERAADVALTLVNAIRDMAYRAYRDSQYQAALDATGNGNEKPRLIVITDPVIERHLMVSGDARTFGTMFDKFEVASSLDQRIYGKIIFSFSRGNADPSDVLSFGTHAWMPELTAALPLNRQGATYREAMVQPRNLHVPKLPILGVINVTGLSKALTSKTEIVMVGRNDITNPYLPGVE